MAQVYIADKATLDAVKTETDKIGNPSDTGTTTLMGKLNNVKASGGVKDIAGKEYFPIMFGTSDTMIERLETLTQIGVSRCLVADDLYIYWADYTDKKIIKFNKSDLTKVSETVAQSGYANYNCMLLDNTYIYYADYTAKKVIKFNKSDLTTVSETSVQSGYANYIVIDDLYIYYADYTSKKVIKFNKSDMSSAGETVAQSGYCAGLTVDDTSIYYSDYTTKKVIIFDKTTMAKTSETPAQYSYSFSIAVDTNYIYYGATFVIKLDKATGTEVARSAGLDGYARGIVLDGNYVYVPVSGGTIRKLDRTTLNTVAETPVINQGGVDALLTDETYVYGSFNTNKKIIKFDKQHKTAYTLNGYEGAI